jgi:glucose/arabinose dehydrogenase
MLRKAAWTALSLIAIAASNPATAGPLRLDLVDSGFGEALFVTAPESGSKIYVLDKTGVITWVDRAAGTRGTFGNLTTQVNAGGERGLLGLAFAPDYVTSRHVYANYSNLAGDTVVARFTANADGTAIDPASERVVLRIAQPAFDNHKGGWIGFRPGDAQHLYIATGDGGSSGDPLNSGQTTTSNLGKILRVDVTRDDFAADDQRNYGIPIDNPFAGGGGNAEIWAGGLRNPWRNSFDRLTGDFWIADVGQDRREEINLELAGTAGGANYGWNLYEGSLTYPGGLPAGVLPAGFQGPLFEYGHESGDSSITGGYVYRGPIEALQGQYVFGDFMSGRIWSLVRDDDGTVDVTDLTSLLATPAGIGGFQLSSFGEDAMGHLYATTIDGRVFVLVPEPGTWALVAGGLGVALATVRRRRRHH